jgi:hypothetical protein
MINWFLKQKTGTEFTKIWAKIAVWGADRGFLDMAKGMGESGAKLIDTMKM